MSEAVDQHVLQCDREVRVKESGMKPGNICNSIVEVVTQMSGSICWIFNEMSIVVTYMVQMVTNMYMQHSSKKETTYVIARAQN